METLRLTIEKMVFEGRALARHDGFVIFVDGALPGETVEVQIIERKRRFAFARVTQIVTPSPHRVTPPCPMFGNCGGCTFQHLDYRGQLEIKHAVLLDCLRSARVSENLISDVLPSPQTIYFRNKMVFAFGQSGGKPVVGLHAKGDWKTVVSAECCLLQSPESAATVAKARILVEEHAIPVWDDLSTTGCLRHLVIREGKKTGERLLHVHVAGAHERLDRFLEGLQHLADTVLISTHLTVPEAAPEHATKVFKGTGRIRERLNGLQFEISANTFFQTNTLQAERMFAMVADWAAALAPRAAADLYAGTGPIALHLSRVAQRVVAVESNPQAVQAGHRNLALNNIQNVSFICSAVEHQRPHEALRDCDLVVVDPPRPGLHRKACDLIATLAPRWIIYVSCNPATLARDLQRLQSKGYRVEKVQPIDLFPHAYHVESITLLSRVSRESQ